MRRCRSATASFAGAGGTFFRVRTTERFFAERMTVRLWEGPHSPGAKETIFHAHQKVAHRADPEVTIEAGNHNALGSDLAPLRAWHPIEVLHFSLRTVEQLERKGHGGWLGNAGYEPTLHQLLLDQAFRRVAWTSSTRPSP